MQNECFGLTRDVLINSKIEGEPVRRAISRFHRDLAMVLGKRKPGKEKAGVIRLEMEILHTPYKNQPCDS